VTYTWKAGTALAGENDIGFVAEDVAQVLPAIVGKDSDGRPASIDYGRVTAVLVEAVKALEARNSETAAELASLKQELAILRKGSEPTASVKRSHLVIGFLALLAGVFVVRSTRNRK
jgi:hypothetical protein